MSLGYMTEIGTHIPVSADAAARAVVYHCLDEVRRGTDSDGIEVIPPVHFASLIALVCNTPARTKVQRTPYVRTVRFILQCAQEYADFGEWLAKVGMKLTPERMLTVQSVGTHIVLRRTTAPAS